MKILITGGFGFLGSRLAEHFIHQGYSVTLASRSTRKLNKNLSGAKTYKVDWKNEENLIEMVKNQDVVIHAAGVNAKNCVNNPEEANSFNANATKKLAQISEALEIKKFLFLSSIHVYSSQLEGVITEESETSNMHPYASSNLAGEQFIKQLDASNPMKAYILRLSSNFGYPAFLDSNSWSLVVNELCLQAIMNKEMVINGSGSDLRDFLPITALCNILDDFLSGHISSSLNTSVYNICSSASLSILEVSEKIQFLCQKEFGFKPSIILNKPLAEESISDFTIESHLKNLLKFNFAELFDAEILRLLKFCQLNKKSLNLSMS